MVGWGFWAITPLLRNLCHYGKHQVSDDVALRALLVEVNDQGREGLS
jgi:hypothetical protein